jgi:hypothetical protein
MAPSCAHHHIAGGRLAPGLQHGFGLGQLAPRGQRAAQAQARLGGGAQTILRGLFHPGARGGLGRGRIGLRGIKALAQAAGRGGQSSTGACRRRLRPEGRSICGRFSEGAMPEPTLGPACNSSGRIRRSDINSLQARAATVRSNRAMSPSRLSRWSPCLTRQAEHRPNAAPPAGGAQWRGHIGIVQPVQQAHRAIERDFAFQQPVGLPIGPEAG